MPRHNNRPPPPPPWYDCLIAATRKVGIAHYHLTRLRECEFGSSNLLPVPTQAHFEGVVYAAVAGGDQSDLALMQPSGCTNLSLNRRRFEIIVQEDEVKEVTDSLPQFDDFKSWFCESTYKTAKELRNEIVHRVHDKRRKDLRWEVVLTGDFGDDNKALAQDVLQYAEDLYAHAYRLAEIVLS